MSFISFDTGRLVIAAVAMALYTLMCATIVKKERIKRHNTARFNRKDSTPHWRIIYASQTGTAEEIARQTADTLQLAGVSIQLTTLSELDITTLSEAGRILFIVSTYGEGNSPDNAALFAKHLHTTLSLGHLHYAALALGDRSYANFCGFGRELDGWLQAQGAQPLFPIVEADKCDPDAIEIWRHQLSHIAGTDDAPDWQGQAYDYWRLSARRLLNPGSQGNNVFHLEFEPVGGVPLPTWESGDLAQIQVPTGGGQPREYSIASVPSDGCLHLLVRLHCHADNTPGASSSWLTQKMKIGDSVQLRVRQHERFRLGTNAIRPLILIGNGTGIAGLRGHLKSRLNKDVGCNWLIFGERNERCDSHYGKEIEAWYRTGFLEKLDLVFSRDQPERRYVQDRLFEVSEALRDWIAQGAAVYVCGSLHGMASGVDHALVSILGQHSLEELSLTGRYRRDVY
jgi:sulfite reductase (NADPH) flavoprotein alpha-component